MSHVNFLGKLISFDDDNKLIKKSIVQILVDTGNKKESILISFNVDQKSLKFNIDTMTEP